MTDGLSRKDEIYNDIIDLLHENHQSFEDPKEGHYIVDVSLSGFCVFHFLSVVVVKIMISDLNMSYG